MSKTKRVGIYRLLNTTNGKSYVGSSIHLGARKRKHFWLLEKGKSHSSRLQRAYNKYGAESFVFEILEECEIAHLEEREIAWVDALDCVASGYNCSRDVKAPARGIVYPADVRLRMSEAQRRRIPTEETREKSRMNILKAIEKRRGSPLSPEHRRKISEAHKGRRLSEETVQKMGNANQLLQLKQLPKTMLPTY